MRIEIDIMTQNVALKLSIPPPAMSALRQHPIIAGAMRLGDVAMLKTVYYDTPNQRLRGTQDRSRHSVRWDDLCANNREVYPFLIPAFHTF